MSDILKLLFGWLIKGQYEISALDKLIATIEVLIIFTIVYLILYFIVNKSLGDDK